jgi:hypothetical protein
VQYFTYVLMDVVQSMDHLSILKQETIVDAGYKKKAGGATPPAVASIKNRLQVSTDRRVYRSTPRLKTPCSAGRDPTPSLPAFDIPGKTINIPINPGLGAAT